MSLCEEKTSPPVALEKRGRAAIIRIQNPPVNVLTGGVLAGIRASLQAVREDPAVAAVIVTGAGDRAFMAGADIKSFPDMCGVPGAAYGYARTVYEVWDELEAFPKPTIAAINGLALGAGLELALVCDMRVADEGARFGFPEISLGLLPGGGGTQRMGYATNPALAKEMVLTGRPIDSDRALRAGLLNDVTPPGGALDKALELAETMADYSAAALALAKRAAGAPFAQGKRAGISVEAEAFQDAFLTRDAKEGVSAFLEKRKPVFQGR